MISNFEIASDTNIGYAFGFLRVFASLTSIQCCSTVLVCSDVYLQNYVSIYNSMRNSQGRATLNRHSVFNEIVGNIILLEIS